MYLTRTGFPFCIPGFHLGINIDHVTVWDSGNSADGKGSTANFLSGLMKSVPPLHELFDQAGLSLPEYLAKKKEAPAVADVEPIAEEEEEFEPVKNDKKNK